MLYRQTNNASKIKWFGASSVEWYYIGHYGQLGPLTKEQMEELIEGSVILSDTYVWKSGMAQWQLAESVGELQSAIKAAAPFAAPPPPPGPQDPPKYQPQQPTRGGSYQAPTASYAPQPRQPSYPASSSFYRTDLAYAVRSDRSRVLAGVLQLFLPGFGRMYLGYYAYGVLQLLTIFCGVGFFWSLIDGIMILAGTVKFDGFGRVLQE